MTCYKSRLAIEDMSSVTSHSFNELTQGREYRDREWQKWPITIVTGAYGGYIVGKLAGKYLLTGKRIEFD